MERKTADAPRIVKFTTRERLKFTFILPAAETATVERKPGAIYLNPASPAEGVREIMEKGRLGYRELREAGFPDSVIGGWLLGSKMGAPLAKRFIEFANSRGLDAQMAFPDLWNWVRRLRHAMGMTLEKFAKETGLGQKKDAHNWEMAKKPSAPCPMALIKLAQKHGIEIPEAFLTHGIEVPGEYLISVP